MKPTKFFTNIAVATGVLFLSSCNSGKEKKVIDTETDTSTAKTVSPVTPLASSPGPASIMIIKVKIANYAKWKLSYDGGDSFRLAHGLHNYIIGRGIEDSNMVIVALQMDDVNKAKEMGASKDLKDRMKRSGVKGTPAIDYVEAVMNDAGALRTATRLQVTHKVADWDKWKEVFDSYKQARGDAGILDRVVSYTVGDNKSVTLIFAIGDIDKAKIFFNSQDIKDKLTEAGVEETPDFFFFNNVEKY